MSDDNGRRLGIWVDHKEALLVIIQREKSGLLRIRSEAAGHHRAQGGTRSPQAAGASASQSEYADRIQHQLSLYYEKLMAHLRPSDTLIIFGPGPAKREFLKQIEASPLQKIKLAGIETVDKMTDKQIMAYVKDFYQGR